jgi:hypothetical protein
VVSGDALFSVGREYCKSVWITGSLDWNCSPYYYIFLMKSTIMGATGKDDFIKCVHFRPERTSTSNKPLFAVCCGARGATG